MTGPITVWRGGTSRAKYPLVVLEPYLAHTGERDGFNRYTFHAGVKGGYRHIDDDDARALLDRHRARGNRIEGDETERTYTG